MRNTKMKPMPHQRTAVNAIAETLMENGHDRTKVIMPCGTGKTVVQLWACEAMGAENVLVLLPSLALVRQSLHEWMKHTSWKNVNCLCVCSDETVTSQAEDEIILRGEDIDFPVTSDPQEIEDFLWTKKGVKLVFSTYHSASLVAEGMPQGFAFDIGIFDEAHKTASEKSGQFTFALEDENLMILKRVFFTATPRHYDLARMKRDEDEESIAYSMDDEKVYGPTAYQLSFRKAVKLGIICDYRVIVSVVTSAMLEKYALDKGMVTIGGRAVPAKVVAHCVAIEQAIKKHGVKKVITFHPRVRDADEFSNGGPQSINPYLPRDFVVTHVSGAMNTRKREGQMDRFRKAKRALVTCARCLTEGVDVPTVDMVAFLSKKRELIDIVQATGRAMRRAPGKDLGYVLVPLYVDQEDGETIEAAAERADFREVWAVLNAMREQDEALASHISRAGRERGLRGDRRDPDIDTDHLESMGPRVDLDRLKQAITTAVIDNLGSNWDEMFGRLCKFKEEHGHCDVPKKAGLGYWLGTQRKAYKNNELSRERIQTLEKIGFSWNTRKDKWDENFGRLVAFKKKHGHCDVPRTGADQKLGEWAHRQRIEYKKNALIPRHKKLLTQSGFVWSLK
jgi:predicted helicase